MEIIIDVTLSEEGRLTGTVGVGAGKRSMVPFSGTMELVARVEGLCRTELVAPSTTTVEALRGAGDGR